MSRNRTIQSHTTHQHPSEVEIHYRFHPRAGCKVPVLHRRRVHGGDCYLIEQPDHTLTYLPVWMTEAPWREVAIRSAPRLPLARLEELQRLVLAAVSSLGSTSCDGGTPHAATRTVRTGSNEQEVHSRDDRSGTGRAVGSTDALDVQRSSNHRGGER